MRWPGAGPQAPIHGTSVRWGWGQGDFEIQGARPGHHYPVVLVNDAAWFGRFSSLITVDDFYSACLSNKTKPGREHEKVIIFA